MAGYKNFNTFFGEDKMRKNLLCISLYVFVAAALVTTFSGIRFAQGAEASKKPLGGMEFIKEHDQDKDGKVSRQEYSGDDFTNMDKNGDGFIVLEEADQKFNPSTHSVNANQIAFIVKFDKDKDGKVSNKEFTGSHFSEFDKNGDGFIEPHEAPEGQTAY
ncbi:hypothetical protein ACFL4N_08910 [Thermodesulfobacteriota bacterium]